MEIVERGGFSFIYLAGVLIPAIIALIKFRKAVFFEKVLLVAVCAVLPFISLYFVFTMKYVKND